jgi:hypothetical protein
MQFRIRRANCKLLGVLVWRARCGNTSSSVGFDLQEILALFQNFQTLARFHPAASQQVRTGAIHEIERKTPTPEAVMRKGEPDSEPKAGETAPRPEWDKGSPDKVIEPPERRPPDDKGSPSGGKKSGEGKGNGKGREPKKD